MPYLRTLRRICCAALFCRVLFAGYTPQTENANASTAASRTAVNNEDTSADSPYQPLDDYIPCLFTEDEEWRHRALTKPPTTANQPLGLAKATQLTDATAAAIKQQLASTAQRFSLLGSGYSDGVVKAFKDDPTIRADALAQLSPTEATFALYSAALKVVKEQTKAANVLQDAERQVDTAVRTATNKALRQPSPVPRDIGCSMAILSWQENSDLFGRRVANEYVAIQVNIRNLNTKYEFLVHDIQVAIDTGLTDDAWNRFEAGRDKLLIRGVAERGSSEDRRNLALHALQVIGAIAGSSAIAGSTDYKIGVAIFQGAFIPGFEKLFPDHTLEQVNHIHDFGFSASQSSKIIVPRQGSVPIVTFIAEKPLEQLPFAWCGYNALSGPFWRRNVSYCDSGDWAYADGAPNPYKNKALAYEDQYGIGPGKRGVPQPPDEAGAINIKDKSKPPYQLAWDSLKYKKWRGAALQILANRTFAVVGGMHIQEVQKAASQVGNVDCPRISGPDALDLAQSKDKTLACTITGSDLDSVSSVALEKGADKMPGKIKAAKDGNSAELTFDVSALSDREGQFSLFLINKQKDEIDTGESVQLAIQPIVNSVDNSLDITKDPATLTVKGSHLDKIASLSLKSDTSGGTVAGQNLKPNSDNTQLAVQFKSGDLTSGKTYHVVYTRSVEAITPVEPKTPLTVEIKGNAPASTPQPKKGGGNGKAKPANAKRPR